MTQKTNPVSPADLRQGRLDFLMRGRVQEQHPAGVGGGRRQTSPHGIARELHAALRWGLGQLQHSRHSRHCPLGNRVAWWSVRQSGLPWAVPSPATKSRATCMRANQEGESVRFPALLATAEREQSAIVPLCTAVLLPHLEGHVYGWRQV